MRLGFGGNLTRYLGAKTGRARGLLWPTTCPVASLLGGSWGAVSESGSYVAYDLSLRKCVPNHLTVVVDAVGIGIIAAERPRIVQ